MHVYQIFAHIFNIVTKFKIFAFNLANIIQII